MLKSYDYKLKSNILIIVNIIDDDFEDAVEIFGVPERYPDIVVPAIIKVYETRNINVVKNLIIFFIKTKSKYQFNMIDEFNHCNKYILEYRKYHEELQKYLVLM